LEAPLAFGFGILTLRLAFILAGVLFCWFGYRLFARTRTPSDAQVSFKNVVKVNLQQIAPGVFFSLFGAAIIVWSIEKLPLMSYSGQDAGGKPAMVRGMQAASVAGVADRAAVQRASDAIAFMNRIDSTTGAVAEQDRKDIRRMSERIRFALMRSVWQAEWGDPADFEASLRDSSRAANAHAREFFERN
jgi:hypothetical protein